MFLLLTLTSFLRKKTKQKNDSKNTLWHFVVKRKFIASLLDNLKHANGRSSRPEVFYKKGVLKNFAKFTGKHQCQSLFLIKLLAEACNLIKKKTLAQVFSYEFCENLKNTFFIEHLLWLVLELLVLYTSPFVFWVHVFFPESFGFFFLVSLQKTFKSKRKWERWENQ